MSGKVTEFFHGDEYFSKEFRVLNNYNIFQECSKYVKFVNMGQLQPDAWETNPRTNTPTLTLAKSSSVADHLFLATLRDPVEFL